MQTTPEIDFQGMEPSAPWRAGIERHIERLEAHYGRMTACRVVVKAPGGRHRTGGHYEINIRLALPDGREVVVEHTPDRDERFQDFDFALNDAFRRADRRLEDEVREMRGAVKAHAAAPVGVVRKLMRKEGYGFVESADGREIYFHRNSVGAPGFDALQSGERVAFIEEEGRDGPQASRVTPLREQAPR
jgi:cold shock CspA family protein